MFIEFTVRSDTKPYLLLGNLQCTMSMINIVRSTSPNFLNNICTHLNIAVLISQAQDMEFILILLLQLTFSRMVS